MTDERMDAVSGSASDGSVRTRNFTCVSCPVGCELTVTLRDAQVVAVEGNGCKRGDAYARAEATDPRRVVTALVDVAGSVMPVSCKTAEAIPKTAIASCIGALREIVLTPPVAIGDVVLADVCGTGVDVVATKDIDVAAEGAGA